MLPPSVGTETNCSAVSLIVPYTLAPGDCAPGTDTAGSGMATLARSSAVILIVSLSLGPGIVPLFAALIRRGRVAGVVWISLGRGCASSACAILVLRIPYDLTCLWVDQLACSRIHQYRHYHDTCEDIPRQRKSQRQR